MSFHPLAYFYFYWKSWGSIINDVLFYICLLPLLALSGWIFWLSQKFQKPILFDRQTELDRKNDFEKLTDQVAELVATLKSNRDEKSAAYSGRFRPPIPG